VMGYVDGKEARIITDDHSRELMEARHGRSLRGIRSG
jgi:hypothetical protein